MKKKRKGERKRQNVWKQSDSRKRKLLKKLVLRVKKEKRKDKKESPKKSKKNWNVKRSDFAC